MKVTSLSLLNFRNIENAQLNFDDGVNIIFGENGQGKTNILEAVWLCGGFKSFRKSREKEFIKFGSDFAKIDVDFYAQKREQDISLIYSQNKRIKLNSVIKKSNSELIGALGCVVFSPSYLSLVSGSPAERRKFCDIALCRTIIGYSSLLSEYNKTLLQRNSFLKDLKYHPDLYEMLDVWNDRLAEYSCIISDERKKYIESLNEKTSVIYSGLSSDTEELKLTYKVKMPFGYSSEKEMTKKYFINLLKICESEDRRFCCASVGAHRDDVEILINSVPARNFGSQGQQRSAALAMKLGEAELLAEYNGEQPVILLDDVMSELDVKRQNYILNNIKDRQVLITCCEPSSVMRLCSGKTFHIQSGKVLK